MFAAANVCGTGATTTTDGSRSGRQMAGDTHAGVSGACGKAQAPTVGQPLHCAMTFQRAGCDLVLGVAVVCVIAGVTPQELDRELRTFEPHHLYGDTSRPPVRRRCHDTPLDRFGC
jgi:hypothetical protein